MYVCVRKSECVWGCEHECRSESVYIYPHVHMCECVCARAGGVGKQVGKYIPMYIPVCMCINIYLAFYLHLLLSFIFSCSSQSSTPTNNQIDKLWTWWTIATGRIVGTGFQGVAAIPTDAGLWQLCTNFYYFFFYYYFLFGCFCLYFVFTVRRLHEKSILFGCSPFSVHE